MTMTTKSTWTRKRRRTKTDVCVCNVPERCAWFFFVEISFAYRLVSLLDYFFFHSCKDYWFDRRIALLFSGFSQKKSSSIETKYAYASIKSFIEIHLVDGSGGGVLKHKSVHFILKHIARSMWQFVCNFARLSSVIHFIYSRLIEFYFAAVRKENELRRNDAKWRVTKFDECILHKLHIWPNRNNHARKHAFTYSQIHDVIQMLRERIRRAHYMSC